MWFFSNILFSFGLAKGGEFAFVLLSYALQNGVMTEEVSSPMIASVAISMALSPLIMLINEKLILPNFGTKEQTEREADTMNAVPSSSRFAKTSPNWNCGW